MTPRYIIRRFTDPLVISLCSFMVAFASFAYIGYTQYENLKFLRESFCGLVEPLTATTPSTPTGETYKQSAANTARKLHCTPDLADGK